MWVTFKENREKFHVNGNLDSWVQVCGALFWTDIPQTCNQCGGDGIIHLVAKHPGDIVVPPKCGLCYGTGWVAFKRNNPKLQKAEDENARQKDA